MKKRVYHWTIEGDQGQIALAEEALESMTFPFRKIVRPIDRPLIRFRDLSKWNSGEHGEAHILKHPKHAEYTGISGASGLFWHDGRVVIHTGLTREFAKSTIVAELMHTIDGFYMTQPMRRKIMRLLPDSKGIWWGGPKDSYYDQDAEALMILGIMAFSPYDWSGWPRDIREGVRDRIPQALMVKRVPAPQKDWNSRQRE